MLMSDVRCDCAGGRTVRVRMTWGAQHSRPLATQVRAIRVPLLGDVQWRDPLRQSQQAV